MLEMNETLTDYLNKLTYMHIAYKKKTIVQNMCIISLYKS